MPLTLDRIEIESAGADPTRLAAALLKQVGDLDGRVPIDDIALALDIEEIRMAPLLRLEACLQCDRLKSRGQIVVNAKSPAKRRRFSVAHELGHFLNERHRPTMAGSFACTAEDMRSPLRQGRHLVQEREANTFAIEVLSPRHLLARHLKRAADLEHVLAISDRFDISRAAAARRYVELHDERLAVVFSKNQQIRGVKRPDAFPATIPWIGDRLPQSPTLPTDGSALTSLDEVSADAWLRAPDGLLFAQTLLQRGGHAITLLLFEPAEAGEPGPQFRRSVRKP